MQRPFIHAKRLLQNHRRLTPRKLRMNLEPKGTKWEFLRCPKVCLRAKSSTERYNTAMKILLLGATGLVGSELKALLQEDSRIESLTCLVRQPCSEAHLPAKVHMELVDFSRLQDYKDLFAVDAVFCALGTTIRKAGSPKAFQSVDLELVRYVGQLAKAQGVSRFLVVSAQGAQETSRILYNRTKGRMEKALTSMDFPFLTIARPSLLMGERKEFRRGELWAQRIARPFLQWIPEVWRPIHARQVAQSLVGDLDRTDPGVLTLSNRVMVSQHPCPKYP